MLQGISRHTYVPSLFSSLGFVADGMGDPQPGGMELLRSYAVPVNAGGECNKWKEADWAFNGGVNRHSQVARRQMKRLRVARVTLS
jgi:stearoyl-CoA desaturase (delta-9 desaturase)